MVVNIREWIDRDVVTSERARIALPILVRQARLGEPITYQDLGQELGMHHRPVEKVAGFIGYTLEAIGQTRGWKRRPPPPLQAIVVNKNTGVPGKGVNDFMTAAYRQAQTPRQKRLAIKDIYSQIHAYPHWEEILELLHLEPATHALDTIVDEAISTKGRGGEGPEHKALKEYIAKNPSVIGLPRNQAPGSLEYPIPSGDRIDVVFKSKNLRTAVEVKSHISDDGDLVRGLFQCLKYRTVLEAQEALRDSPLEISIFLVVGRAFPERLIPIKNSLRVSVIDQVAPC